MKKLNVYISALVLVLALFSCKKETNEKQLENNVQFSFDPAGQNLLKSTAEDTTLNSAKAILISVEDLNGKVLYNNEEVELFNMNGRFISKPISLQPGGYKLTKFMVIDKDNNVIYATPLSGSAYAPFVSNPLPICFSVTKDAITNLVPQVISTKNHVPQDFGYASFSFDVVKTLNFALSVFAFNSSINNLELTASDLIIVNNTTFQVSHWSLLAENKVFNMKDDGVSYTISIYKPGYKRWVKNFTGRELNENGPLNIVLEEDKAILISVQTSNFIKIKLQGTGKFYIYRGASGAPCKEVTLSQSSEIVEIPEDEGRNIAILGDIEQLTGIGLYAYFGYQGVENALNAVNLSCATGLKWLCINRLKVDNLDISKNSKLDSLYLSQGDLKNFDVSNNPELRYFGSWGMNIDNYDLSKNTKLEKVYFSGFILVNELNSITLNNPKLTSFDLNGLYVKTAIDFTNCPNLSTLNFNGGAPDINISGNNMLNNVSFHGSVNQLNSLCVNLLNNVQQHPRTGSILSWDNTCPTDDGLAARNSLEQVYGWSAKCE